MWNKSLNDYNNELLDEIMWIKQLYDLKAFYCLQNKWNTWVNLWNDNF